MKKSVFHIRRYVCRKKWYWRAYQHDRVIARSMVGRRSEQEMDRDFEALKFLIGLVHKDRTQRFPKR